MVKLYAIAYILQAEKRRLPIPAKHGVVAKKGLGIEGARLASAHIDFTGFNL